MGISFLRNVNNRSWIEGGRVLVDVFFKIWGFVEKKLGFYVFVDRIIFYVVIMWIKLRNIVNICEEKVVRNFLRKVKSLLLYLGDDVNNILGWGKFFSGLGKIMLKKI